LPAKKLLHRFLNILKLASQLRGNNNSVKYVIIIYIISGTYCAPGKGVPGGERKLYLAIESTEPVSVATLSADRFALHIMEQELGQSQG
jgi:hypothetical protein